MIQDQSPLAEYDPPLDPGIRQYVETVNSEGIPTVESCEGGPGHAFAEPTVRFKGDQETAFRALAIAQRHHFPVSSVRQIWPLYFKRLRGPYWELTFWKN